MGYLFCIVLCLYSLSISFCGRGEYFIEIEFYQRKENDDVVGGGGGGDDDDGDDGDHYTFGWQKKAVGHLLFITNKPTSQQSGSRPWTDQPQQRNEMFQQAKTTSHQLYSAIAVYLLTKNQ